jgi:hypothetical protein
MNGNNIIEEQYQKGSDVINFVVYRRTTGAGEDEVLQHKIMGITETAHITLHPDGTVNFRVKRSKTYLADAVRNDLQGYTPAISERLKRFLAKVRTKI